MRIFYEIEFKIIISLSYENILLNIYCKYFTAIPIITCNQPGEFNITINKFIVNTMEIMSTIFIVLI